MAAIKKEIFHLRPYTPKELRQLYGISHHTFQKWIEPFITELGEPLGGAYNVHQVKLIIDKLGFPQTVEY